VRAGSGPAALAGPDPASLRAALDSVIDPELDESLVRLGFVEGLRIEGSRVLVELRLPTFWCAPNFAYLMARDARDRLRQVEGVEDVEVVLKDHFASNEISQAATGGRPFEETFAGEANGNLDGLRALFRRKAYLMRLERLIRFLLESGLSDEEVTALRVGDVEGWHDELVQSYLTRRREFGLSTDGSARLVMDARGRAIYAGGLAEFLRGARRQRISTELNASFCRGMLATRYGLPTREGRG
jgi:metal-sulfur cluster biosynthetic enzyme